MVGVERWDSFSARQSKAEFLEEVPSELKPEKLERQAREFWVEGKTSAKAVWQEQVQLESSQKSSGCLGHCEPGNTDREAAEGLGRARLPGEQTCGFQCEGRQG